ncbi:MAG TPA: hypothetical protein VKH63_04950 [Candidatus Acidoferrum sp.]|nr:hypothetical protein [Candidatus Acidoferrum sp.]
MRSQHFKAIAILAMGMMFLFWVGREATAKAEDWDRDGQTLEGTWVVTVTQQACPSGPAIAPPFKSLLTFNAGGTMTETTDNPMFFPALRGPGHGVWSHTGRHTYSADTMALVTVNGVLAKTQKISQTIEMGDDPDQFTTTAASVQFFDPTGTLLVSGCATATGQRFE